MRSPISLSHHGRFYASLLLGAATFAAARLFGLPAPTLAGGDAFFVAFLASTFWLVPRQSAETLEHSAGSEDEGILIVVLVTLAAISFFCTAVFAVLNRKSGSQNTVLALAGAGAILGWFVFHTVMAFHYANLHYFVQPAKKGADVPDLKFPHTAKPCPWDFLYFSFVIGMTAQVSDVQVQTAAMRRAVLAHGVVSFFFNTVFIAMAVNAVVSAAS